MFLQPLDCIRKLQFTFYFFLKRLVRVFYRVDEVKTKKVGHLFGRQNTNKWAIFFMDLHSFTQK